MKYKMSDINEEIVINDSNISSSTTTTTSICIPEMKELNEDVFKNVEMKTALELTASASEVIKSICPKMATTVPLEALKEVEKVEKEVVQKIEETRKTGQSLLEVSSLSSDQKKIATSIYTTTKSAIQSILLDSSLNNSIKVTLTISKLVKELEIFKVDGPKLSGADKKAITIELGRILLQENLSENKEILVIYDLLAESTLEAMIDVSRVVNVAVQEIATHCCPGLLAIFKKIK
jgi:hypothetical protein